MDSAPDAVVMRGVGRIVAASGKNRSTNTSIALLTDITFHLTAGDRLHIVGPSGAGKSTLIRLINRLDEPSQGDLSVLGRPIGAWPVRELRRHVAMVFQEPSLIGRSVRDNLRLPFELIGDMPDDIDQRMVDALHMSGLDITMLDRHGDELSLGQKHRVTLARALITQPRILLLDEPTSSLDPPTAAALLDRVAAISAERALTVIMVTHRLDEARRLGGKLAVLIAGRLRALGPVEQMIENAGDEEACRFLHHPVAKST